MFVSLGHVTKPNASVEVRTAWQVASLIDCIAPLYAATKLHEQYNVLFVLKTAVSRFDALALLALMLNVKPLHDQIQFQWRLCVCLRNLESSLLVIMHMNNFRWFSTQMFALKYQNYWRNIQLPSAPIKDVWRREFWSNLSVCLCV